uniref:HMG box domain-containing protein n=1 Tax=Rhabditophanes sp. KR3021 TaxID=114890 RepID=A0AC35U1I3_9BILA
MIAADDQADEVKVFRKVEQEDGDGDGGQSADSMYEVKKEVALEDESELRNGENLIDPTTTPRRGFQFNPALANIQAQMSPQCFGMPMMMPCLIPDPAAMAMSSNALNQMMSPAFNYLSPQLQMYRNFMTQNSPMYANSYMQNLNAMAASMGRPMGPNNGLNFGNMGNNYGSAPFMGTNSYPNTPKASKSRREDHSPEKPHVKKPLNAFMWYMKENRPKLLEEVEYKEKQSAELNKILGKNWHNLDKVEQQKYYDMAKKDREEHAIANPDWSARDNYAIRKKKKSKRVKSLDNADRKKCRARYSVNQKERWCKHCLRKKRCIYSKSESIASSPAVQENSRTPAMSSPASSGMQGSIDDKNSESESETDTNRTTVLQDISQTPTQRNLSMQFNLGMPMPGMPNAQGMGIGMPNMSLMGNFLMNPNHVWNTSI